MSHDDELRSRLGRLAETRGITDLSFDDVKERRSRHGRQKRVLAVAAVFTLVLGTVGVIRLFNDDGSSEVDIASDTDADAGDVAESDEDTPRSTTTTVPTNESSDVAAATTAPAFDGGEYGPEWVVAWGEGFLSVGQVFEPSEATMQELIPDIADRFPPEIIEALDGVTDIDESVEILTEAGLIDAATQIVTADPELFDAYNQVTSGGSYRFEASVSVDGQNWTVVKGLAAPGGSQSFNNVHSDGEHLVVAEQLWDETDGGTTEILVSSTTDLFNWTTTTIPVDRLDVPDYVSVDVSLNDVAIGNDGWYATTVTTSWIDMWSLFPDDVLSELEESGYGWSATPEGLVIEEYGGGEYAYDSFLDEAEPVEVVEPTEIRTIPWSELGITYDEYQAYNGGFNPTSASSAWVGTWDGSLTPASPPRASECCRLIGTDAGFIAQSWGSDYAPTPDVNTPELYFSADGQSWTEISGPPDAGWFGSITPVEGGIVMTTSTEDGQQLWRGSPSGTNWVSVDIPGVPAGSNIWFEGSGSRGIATVVDLAVSDYVYEQVEFETTLEWDGFEIYTYNHSDGTVDFRITEVASGDVVAEHVLDLSRSTLPEFLDYTGESVDFFDSEGELIVSVPFEESTRVASEAEAAAREASGWVEPDYDYNPDFWLVASHDGVDWFVEDLADPQEGWYQQGAINGTTVVMRGESGWVAFDIG